MKDSDERSSSNNCLSSGYNILVDENHKLKKENKALCSELLSMKRKCKELLDLVSIYPSSSKEKEEDERPKLFGVRLEVHGDNERKRTEEINESARGILHLVNANK